jgi:hypothetical protein
MYGGLCERLEGIHPSNSWYQTKYLLTSNNLMLKIIETGENLVMPVVIMEGLMTDGKIALEKTGQGVKKGQKEEKNMWADSFTIMCLFCTIFIKDPH